MFAPHRTFASTYQRVQVESSVSDASPHRLVGMLFDGAIDAIAQARGAHARGDEAARGERIGRAVRILEEGLRGGLDRQSGGELATNLDALYRYMIQRLTHANLRRDEAPLRECAELLGPLREAWQQISPPAGRG